MTRNPFLRFWRILFGRFPETPSESARIGSRLDIYRGDYSL